MKGKTNQHRPAVPAAADTRSISELTKMILTHGLRERDKLQQPQDVVAPICASVLVSIVILYFWGYLCWV